MMTTRSMSATASNDAELVAESRSGNRDAFGQIVARYQSLICSMAYSATGNLTHSEDLAQETFVAAWKQLKQLREPAKLRPWLCGIARNLVNNWLRRQGREPSHTGETLDAIAGAHSLEPLPPDHTITREEEAILWRSLERIPEIYREPLVLFYREQQSVDAVAAALDLSADAVKQRLSRGRKLLAEEVTAFVEGALKLSAPGRAFTVGVLAALPVFVTSASAATVASAAAKGTATAAGASLVTILASLLGPAIGILGGYLGVRSSIDSTRTPAERKFVVRQAKVMVAQAVVFNLLVFGYVIGGCVGGWTRYPVAFVLMGVALPLGLVASILVIAVGYNRSFRRIREAERELHPEAYAGEVSVSVNEFSEYRSRSTFLGLPLIHIRTGQRAGEKAVMAKGWIAIGDRAAGVLFAAGGVAVGAISMGGVSVGGVSLGGLALGLLAVGGLALGGLAMGGGAVGLLAAGGSATAWFGANGAMALAHEYAVGALALARHANDGPAREFFEQYRWMNMDQASTRNAFTIICWTPMLLLLWHWHRQRKMRALRQRKDS
jgi:RNA polymerase sigma factor (sigma-70 family)